LPQQSLVTEVGAVAAALHPLDTALAVEQNQCRHDLVFSQFESQCACKIEVHILDKGIWESRPVGDCLEFPAWSRGNDDEAHTTGFEFFLAFAQSDKLPRTG